MYTFARINTTAFGNPSGVAYTLGLNCLSGMSSNLNRTTCWLVPGSRVNTVLHKQCAFKPATDWLSSPQNFFFSKPRKVTLVVVNQYKTSHAMPLSLYSLSMRSFNGNPASN